MNIYFSTRDYCNTAFRVRNIATCTCNFFLLPTRDVGRHGKWSWQNYAFKLKRYVTWTFSTKTAKGARLKIEIAPNCITINYM